MNRKIRNFFWYAFLVWAAAEFIVSVSRVHVAGLPALTLWLDFGFYALGAAVIWCEVVAHVGRSWVVAVLFTVSVGAIGAWAWALHMGLVFTPALWPLLSGEVPLAPLLLWWNLLVGFYLTWHRALPVFDARVVALLTAVSMLLADWLLEPFAARRYYWSWAQGAPPWLNYLGWLTLSFVVARLVPLRGDSQPDNLRRPLTVSLLTLALFVTARF